MSDVSSLRPHFVVNARTTGARALRELDALREAAAREFPGAPWLLTKKAGHAVELADAAAACGASLVVAVGGDGTINEVVNGLLHAAPSCTGLTHEERAFAGSDHSVSPPPTLGIIPFGSGSDFVKTVGIPRDPYEALRLLARGCDRRIDVGLVECAPLGEAVREEGDLPSRSAPPGQGRPELRSARREPPLQKQPTPPSLVRRYFVNIAGCGASGRVVERFNRRQIPGTLGYVVATATAAMGYQWPLVQVTVDDEASRTVRLNVLFVCNAEYCGGGMHVGLGARVDDGVLRVVEAANVSRVRALLQWPRLYRGGLERTKGIRLVDGRVVRVTSSDDVLVDTDGELCGCLPATYSVVSNALTVRTP